MSRTTLYRSSALDTNLELDGVDATYACTRAVLEKVLVKESSSHA